MDGNMKRSYTFDDVALVPQFNNIPSRTEPILESWLTKDRKIAMPLLASNMDTVIGEELAEILLKNGSIPIYYRFTDFEKQSKWVQKFRDKTFISCGILPHKLDETRKLLDLGARSVNGLMWPMAIRIECSRSLKIEGNAPNQEGCYRRQCLYCHGLS